MVAAGRKHSFATQARKVVSPRTSRMGATWLAWARRAATLRSRTSSGRTTSNATSSTGNRSGRPGGKRSRARWSAQAAELADAYGDPYQAHVNGITENLGWALAASVGSKFLTGVAGMSATTLRARQGDPHEALQLFVDLIDLWERAGNWTQQWTMLRSLAATLARLGRVR
jgi:hypothetical protein